MSMTVVGGVSTLEAAVGIRPSAHWMEDCRRELRLTGEESEASLDAIFQQILYHDLRDVVRDFDEQNATTSTAKVADDYSNLASVMLRQAIRHSLQPPTYKANLPESFRLLVQVEELLDVSVNAELRLAVGPGSASSPTAVGNQNNRLLKMIYTDGYTSTGSPLVRAATELTQHQAADHPDENLVSMELSPVPSLSVNSLAGSKVLLTGPMTVRRGVILWHPGNACCLGGCVEELAELQRKALQQARTVAGVGVDPTIKALIWNPEERNEEPIEHDEGEHESRDVVQQPNPIRVQQPPAYPPNVPSQASRAVAIAREAPAFHNPITSTEPSSSAFAGPTAVHSTARGSQLVSQHPIRAVNPYLQDSKVSSNATRSRAHLLPTTPSLPGDSITRHNESPLSLTGSSCRVSTCQTAASMYQQEMQGTAGTDSNGQGMISHSHLGFTTNVSAGHGPLTGGTGCVVTGSKTAPTAVTGPLSMIDRPRLTTVTHAQSHAPTTDGMVADVLVVQRPFESLHRDLWQARQDPLLYQQLYGKTFVTSMQQVGAKLDFNIVRGKKRHQNLPGNGGSNRYEYCLVARFQGPTAMGTNCSDGSGLLTCVVGSSILEPFFDVPPDEMRKLNRGEEKERSKALVREGGKKVQLMTQSLGSYEVTLLLPPDEFFAHDTTPPAVDGEKAILLLIRRLE